MSLPYWVSPVRRGIDPQTKEAAIVIDVAPSRAERRRKGKTVLFPLSDFEGLNPDQISGKIAERIVTVAQTL